MLARIVRWQPDQGAAVAARAVGALALAALAVIHVVDLPGTLGPDRLVGIGYLGIIAVAILTGGVLIARPHRLAWVPAGWRAVGCLQVKGAEHELACRFDLRLDDSQPGGPPCLKVASSLVIDSQWVTRQRIPALDRRIVMTCSLSLEPDM